MTDEGRFHIERVPRTRPVSRGPLRAGPRAGPTREVTALAERSPGAPSGQYVSGESGRRNLASHDLWQPRSTTRFRSRIRRRSFGRGPPLSGPATTTPVGTGPESRDQREAARGRRRPGAHPRPSRETALPARPATTVPVRGRCPRIWAALSIPAGWVTARLVSVPATTGVGWRWGWSGWSLLSAGAILRRVPAERQRGWRRRGGARLRREVLDLRLFELERERLGVGGVVLDLVADDEGVGQRILQEDRPRRGRPRRRRVEAHHDRRDGGAGRQPLQKRGRGDGRVRLDVQRAEPGHADLRDVTADGRGVLGADRPAGRVDRPGRGKGSR